MSSVTHTIKAWTQTKTQSNVWVCTTEILCNVRILYSYIGLYINFAWQVMLAHAKMMLHEKETKNKLFFLLKVKKIWKVITSTVCLLCLINFPVFLFFFFCFVHKNVKNFMLSIIFLKTHSAFITTICNHILLNIFKWKRTLLIIAYAVIHVKRQVE